jgi:hypothetical protein
MTTPITKDEVLQQLSAKLRNDALSDDDFVRLLTVYAKLSGWFK